MSWQCECDTNLSHKRSLKMSQQLLSETFDTFSLGSINAEIKVLKVRPLVECWQCCTTLIEGLMILSVQSAETRLLRHIYVFFTADRSGICPFTVGRAGSSMTIKPEVVNSSSRREKQIILDIKPSDGGLSYFYRRWFLSSVFH